MKKHDLYTMSLADGMMDCLTEYLDKAAPEADEVTRRKALCLLGSRIGPRCGACICLPEVE